VGDVPSLRIGGRRAMVRRESLVHRLPVYRAGQI
jgi:hypothetical protein